jgi:hypothetical protein
MDHAAAGSSNAAVCPVLFGGPMKKRFTAPVLRREATLDQLTLQGEPVSTFVAN